MKSFLLALILASACLAASPLRCRVVAVSKEPLTIHWSRWVSGGNACADLYLQTKFTHEIFRDKLEYRMEVESFGHKETLTFGSKDVPVDLRDFLKNLPDAPKEQ